jgi:hypothetical protein
MQCPPARATLASIVLSAATLAPLTTLVSQSSGTPNAAPIAITDVTVIDVVAGRRVANRTVVIQGARINVVGPRTGRGAVRIPDGATLVDGRGKFLIPGLWDMHVHALPRASRPRATETFFPLFVANGVTGIRDMGDLLDTLVALRARGTRESPATPRLVAAGPIVDGPQPTFPDQSIAVASPNDAPRIVDSLAAASVDFIKVYSRLPRETYQALATAARRRGIPFAGHVPVEVSVRDASDAGQASVEHMADIVIDCSRDEDAIRRDFVSAIKSAPPGAAELTRARRAARTRAVATVDWPKCRALFEHLARNGTWVTPTLVVGANAADTTRPNDPRLRYFERATVAGWRAERNAGAARPAADSSTIRPAQLAEAAPYVREMARAGVRLLAGTDLPNAFTLSGFDLHAELALLVEAGLTPAAALRAATVDAARFLRATDSLGTVASGRLADLVLLDADPLANIHNTATIRAVFLNGRYLDRAALDALLAGVERLVR